jgi:hypothetical protein
MKTILNALARLLRAILTGLAQTSYMGLFAPIPRPGESDGAPSRRDGR